MISTLSPITIIIEVHSTIAANVMLLMVVVTIPNFNVY